MEVARNITILILAFCLLIVLPLTMSYLFAQQSGADNQTGDSKLLNTTDQNNMTISNTTIDQAFDILRNNFDSLLGKK